jgi:hypothetical protein
MVTSIFKSIGFYCFFFFEKIFKSNFAFDYENETLKQKMEEKKTNALEVATQKIEKRKAQEKNDENWREVDTPNSFI